MVIRHQRREKIGKSYTTRRKDGTFKKWTSIKSSMRRDKSIKAKYKPKHSRQGNTGDYSSPSRPTSFYMRKR